MTRLLTVKDRRPEIGDVIRLHLNDHFSAEHTQEATVYEVTPTGHFSAEWYAGKNRFAPNLPGHWGCRFNPDGTPTSDSLWLAVGYVSRVDGGPVTNQKDGEL